MSYINVRNLYPVPSKLEYVGTLRTKLQNVKFHDGVVEF
jgi:hypothetical protein